MKTRYLTVAALLVAIGTLSAHLIYLPVGGARIFPVQHAINVLAGVLLGPWWAAGTAFAISLLRNLVGTGSLMAFPGSIFGAFLAGLLFQKTHKKVFAALGEVVGTGFIGALVAFPIARFLLGLDVAAFFYVAPFLSSTVGGSIIGYAILGILERNKITEEATEGKSS